MMDMTVKMDIIDCLIYLEEHGVTNEQIIEKMGCNRGTVNDWWKNEKCSPKYLRKMQRFCDDFTPISDLVFLDRPPKYMFVEAVENGMKLLHEKGFTETPIFKKLKKHLYLCGHPEYYDSGIPANPNPRRQKKYQNWYRKDRPKTEFVQNICRWWHPDERVKDFFKK